MEAEVAAKLLVESYRAYAGLLEALGHGVDAGAVAAHLGDDEEQRARLERLLCGAGDGDVKGIAAEAAERMQELSGALLREVTQAAEEDLPGGPPCEVAAALASCEEAQRDLLADVVLLNGHRQFLRPRYMDLGELRRELKEREDGGQFALVRLVPFLREELRKRGLETSERSIRSWFDEESEAGQAPYCVRSILRGVNGEFATGLIPLEELVGQEDADAWLEEARRRLSFRSHSAMHKAIAEVSSLKYDCVHKALSGKRKAKRIQAEIKYCLDKWLEDLEEGREPAIDEDYLGVPVEQMHDLMAALERKFHTKEELYRLISRTTGIKTGSVRRYFQSNGQLKYAPLCVFRCARELATTNRLPRTRVSYLTDRRTRKVAVEMAQRAQQMLMRWRSEGEGSELEVAYRELRRALIVTIKERRHKAPVLMEQ